MEITFDLAATSGQQASGIVVVTTPQRTEGLLHGHTTIPLAHHPPGSSPRQAAADGLGPPNQRGRIASDDDDRSPDDLSGTFE